VCGIAGIVRFDQPASAFAARLGPMRARLRHRGPDGEGELVCSHAALAHTRLAMLDLGGGAQPLRSPDGRFALTYNGELYNDLALRRRLDFPFRTRCDAETLLAAWAAWGERALLELDGMFAFFLWDEALQTGFAARDRLGVKPLAYAHDGRELRFASEARALLTDRTARADDEAIVEYLVAPAFSGVSRSPFAGVSYLQPGELLRIDARGLRTRRYWSWSPSQSTAASTTALESASDAQQAVPLREAFLEGVQQTLRADVPLGLFLSGGLDSTAIAAAAAASGVLLPAFTITYEGQPDWRDSALVLDDDTPHARAAAAALGLPFHEVPQPRAALADELRALAAANDALPAWEQELSQRALSRAAARLVKGVLVGDAADETHYGYHFLLDEQATSGPRAIFARLGSVPIARAVDADPVARLDGEYRALAADAGSRYGDPLERVAATTQLIVRRWLPRLLHNGDIHTMRFGLEARVPFASNALLEQAQRASPARALRGGVEKALLRDALLGWMPEPARRRRKSALPKDQGAQAVYQAELQRLELHPLVRRLVDLNALAPLLRAPLLREAERAQLFRVLSLHQWAVAHEVV